MYDDPRYVENYLENGVFPKIHDNAFKVSKTVVNEKSRVLDVGCCTGLVSVRLAEICEKVVGVDKVKAYLDMAPTADNVEYEHLKIQCKTLDKLKEIIKENKIDTAFMRRVLPELWDTDGDELLAGLQELFYKTGIKTLIIEGRVVSKRSNHKYKSIEREITIFQDRYTVHDTDFERIKIMTIKEE